ncbi:MAG: HAMP domain-containing protein [Myxococcales bacterium]|nr:HAMP domain-containing protein [Myxococcales bacterium]
MSPASGQARRTLLWCVVGALALSVAGGLALHARVRATIDAHGAALAAIAAEAAAGVDAALHARVRGPADAEGAAFETIRHHLRTVVDRHRLRSPVYTLRRDGDVTRFVVMTNATPFVGEPYSLRRPMVAVFEGAARAHSGLYGDDHGRWVSGYAPVRGADGRVEALVSVDRPADDLLVERRRAWLWTALLGLLGALLGAAAPAARRAWGGGVGRLLAGSLALRIGWAGSAAVVLAVGVAGVLNYRSDRAAAVQRIEDRLATAVRVGVHQLDPAAHRRVAATGAAGSEDFRRLRDALRAVKEAAGLDSPVYTLRRDGSMTRFVVMTNETPFVGDPYELRPGMAATFERGQPGAEGPYDDAHGTWISAWAPLFDADGAVIAVLQADAEVGGLIAALRTEALQQVVFGLAGIAVAFLLAFVLARGVARPIAAIAEAADRVGTGDFSVRVEVRGDDEVAALGRAINDMARGLDERERLRGMFGRYMASQVVETLLDAGEVRLSGELRPLTVVISDIRGYTALTEALGAEDVVALLNDYFAILVEAVVRREGVVDKFMGDAMLCWFGAPMDQPDHAQRAVDACADIMRALDAWNAERATRGLAPVHTGIGVATGDVVVGNIGSAQRLEYTAIGDAVNLASRLCSKADAGQVLVSGAVRAAVEAPLEPVGAMQVKGVAEPVEVHRLRWAGPS